MDSNLRPLTLGEILDRTAQLYRTNFVLFAGIFSIYAGFQLILNLLLIGETELLKIWHLAEKLSWLTIVSTIVSGLVLFLVAGISVAAISRAVAWVHLGEPASIRGAYKSILPRIGRYLWLMTITFFVVWTPLVILYAGYFTFMAFHVKGYGTPSGLQNQQAAMADPKSMAIIGIATLGFLALLLPVSIYTILMALRYALALPACVVQNLPARASLRRSIDLSTGGRARIFVLAVLIGAIKLCLAGVTQVFVFISVFKHRGQISTEMSIISQVITFFTTTFLGPIWAAGITLFYYDQRVRKEGFDIEWMMQAAGLTAPAPPPAALPTQQPAEPWLALDAHFDPPPSPEPPPSAQPPTAQLSDPHDPGEHA
ncbi:MAG: hypothetical protein ABR976_07820 [Terracidiphilus sp.]|jgi:hypothetical protein